MTYTTYEELNEVQQVETNSFPKIKIYDYTEKEALIAIKEKLGVNNFTECVYIGSDQVIVARKDKNRYIEMRNRQYEEKKNFIMNNMVHVIRSEIMDYGYMDSKDPKPILDSLKGYVDIKSEDFKKAWALAEKYESEPEIYFDIDGLVERILSANIKIQLCAAKALDEFKKVLDVSDFNKLTDYFSHSSCTDIRAEMARHGYMEGLESDYSEVVQKAIREYYQKQEKQSNLTREQEKKQKQRNNNIEDIEIH